MFTATLDRRILTALIGRIRYGSLTVRWPDGSATMFGEGAPSADMTINDVSGLLDRLWRQGSVGLAASYIDAGWSTSDLATLLEVASRNIDAASSEGITKRTRDWLRSAWRRRPRTSAPEAIGAMDDHYNLGNDFYAAWLDPSMTYSSALFDHSEEALTTAQHRKYQQLCEYAQFHQGDRVLEIGCGWGGFADFAASNFGVHVTGITLSTKQAAYARERLADAGLGELTEIRIQDFRDVTETYDKIISIEMIESVDETLWEPLFATISRSLRSGGRAAMQAITIDEAFYTGLLDRDDFIKAYIFPGGALPSLTVLQDLTATAGLVWEEMAMHGADYAETLHRWSQSFEVAWPRIQDADPTFDDRFRRMWRYYLEYCEAGFRTGRIDGIQFSMAKP